MRWFLCLSVLVCLGGLPEAKASPTPQVSTQQAALSERRPEPTAPLILGLGLLALALVQRHQNKSLVNRGNSHIAKADPVPVP